MASEKGSSALSQRTVMREPRYAFGKHILKKLLASGTASLSHVACCPRRCWNSLSAVSTASNRASSSACPGLLHVLPQQAPCRGTTDGASLAARAHPCPQRVWTPCRRSASASSAIATAVCLGHGRRQPSPRPRFHSLAQRGGQRPWLAPERFPRDTRPRRGQQTSRHGAEAAGSFGRAGQGPTPPSSTASPSSTPPRPCLRDFQATQSSRASGHKGMAVCAAVGGPVSATPIFAERNRLTFLTVSLNVFKEKGCFL
jgi:hypothetical protein